MKNKMIMSLIIGITLLFFWVLIVYNNVISKPVSCQHSALEISYYRSNSFNAWLSPILLVLAALSGLFALYYQRKSLIDQGKRIVKSDEQNNNLQLENSFYRLIQNHNKIAQGLSYNFIVPKALEQGNVIHDKFNAPLFSSTEVIKLNRKGYECFWQFSHLLVEKFRFKPTLQPIDVVSIYNELYSQYSSILSHYLRQFYYILVFIDEMNLYNDSVLNKPSLIEDGEQEILAQIEEKTDEDRTVYRQKYEYAKILRAQLSSDELLILACNALTTQGRKSLFYVRKYRMLKNMNIENLPLGLNKYMRDTYPHLAYELDNL